VQAVRPAELILAEAADGRVVTIQAPESATQIAAQVVHGGECDTVGCRQSKTWLHDVEVTRRALAAAMPHIEQAVRDQVAAELRSPTMKDRSIPYNSYETLNVAADAISLLSAEPADGAS